MRWIKFLLATSITAFLCWGLTSPKAGLPLPLGTFLDPSEGFWQNANQASKSMPEQLDLPDLLTPVDIVMDARGVPHIFAQNDLDLYIAQGYMEARDRLWQMEFQTHAAAGRMSEIIGAKAIGYDMKMRRLGLPWAATRMDSAVKVDDPQTAAIVDAYARGVNAYIEQLAPEDYPLEYKLLGYKPETWTTVKSWLLLKYMANILTGGADDIAMTQAWNAFGQSYADILYPDRSYMEEPIISADHRWDFRPEKIPLPPLDYAADSLMMPGRPYERQDAVGSNNWAVHGSKSSTGSPLLANDPHLSLGLPSVWYELQLSAKDHNSYGVSFPGSPGIMIGFNDSIAWGVTNGSIDVQDYYSITFTDENWTHYVHGDTILPVIKRIEKISVKKREEAVYDTVSYTHHGPVMYDRKYGKLNVPLALRWTAHDSSVELRTFIELNKAKNYADYKKAISHFVCPGQNFVFASASGDIAMTQQGKFPLRWEGQGRYVLDGSKPEHDWQGFIPTEHNPAEQNPPRGYVASTNQHPTTTDYPYYYTGSFAEDRSRQLAGLMKKDSLDVDDMKAFQQDNLSIRAQDLLPVLLSQLDSVLPNEKEQDIRSKLEAWDYRFEKDAAEPVMFQFWEAMLNKAIWSDELKAEGRNLMMPTRMTTIGLIRDSLNFRFYDNINTEAKETRESLIQSTFSGMVDSIYKYNPDPSQWIWYKRKSTTIRHLMDRGGGGPLESFSRMEVPIGGFNGILNAAGTRWGPSWRMVVSLGGKVEAWGVYPGGQSGNPGSSGYDAFVDDWAAGEYYRLWFMQSPAEQDSLFLSTTRVQSGS